LSRDAFHLTVTVVDELETAVNWVGTEGARKSLLLACVEEMLANARGRTRHKPTRIRVVAVIRTVIDSGLEAEIP
jgi:hypothetical protein